MSAWWADGNSMRWIADQLNVQHGTIKRAFLRLGITPEVRMRHIRGKLRMTDNRGYVLVWIRPEDPIWETAPSKNRTPTGGYILEHRVIMARHLGRALRRSETVHHKNGIKTDNRIENLQLRQGQHGAGAHFVCGDCGSHNVVSALL